MTHRVNRSKIKSDVVVSVSRRPMVARVFWPFVWKAYLPAQIMCQLIARPKTMKIRMRSPRLKTWMCSVWRGIESAPPPNYVSTSICRPRKTMISISVKAFLCPNGIIEALHCRRIMYGFNPCLLMILHRFHCRITCARRRGGCAVFLKSSNHGVSG